MDEHEVGTEVTPYKYDEVKRFSEGLAAVCVGRSDGKWGFIDETGKEVIPCMYDVVNDFSEGLAVVGIGRLRLDSDSSDSYAVFVLSGKWGCINKSGIEIIPIGKYKLVGYYRDSNSSSDYVQYEIDNCTYGHRGFNEGLTPVCDWETDKFGFVDRAGNEVIPPMYDLVRKFSNGIAEVFLGDKENNDKANAKWLCIDKDGNEQRPHH